MNIIYGGFTPSTQRFLPAVDKLIILSSENAKFHGYSLKSCFIQTGVNLSAFVWCSGRGSCVYYKTELPNSVVFIVFICVCCYPFWDAPWTEM